MPVPAPTYPGNFQILPIEQLLTSYAPLRSGAVKRFRPRILADLPLRVVPVADHKYEVLDGFKRLAAWKQEGYQQIPVVIENAGSPEDHKALLLAANAPLRTLTPADEAEVVASLKEEDGLSESQIARTLFKSKTWVARRLDLQAHLGPTAKESLKCGHLGPSAGHALCALSNADQRAVLEAAKTHALTGKESMALFSAFRVADAPDRKILLKDPKGQLSPEPSPTQSEWVTTVERQLEIIRHALFDLMNFQLPDLLSPPEHRRLEAVYRAVLVVLRQTAQTLLSEQVLPKESSVV